MWVQIAELEEGAHVKDAHIDGLTNSLDKLCAEVNSMEDHLCYCSEGMGKGKEVIKR